MVSVSITAFAVIGAPVVGTAVSAGAIFALGLALWDMGWQIADIVDDFQ